VHPKHSDSTIAFHANIAIGRVSNIAFRVAAAHISIPGAERVCKEKKMNALLDKPDTVVPTEKEAEQATESSRILAKVRPEDGLRVRIETGEEFVLPKAAVQLLSRLLTEMSQGNAVTLIPLHAELTTQEAADFLNVSRPYLIALLEERQIPYRKVGTHRRIKFGELQAFKKRNDEEHAVALNELAAQAQELKLGY
jgi:excisionase family DNA binding protein